MTDVEIILLQGELLDARDRIKELEEALEVSERNFKDTLASREECMKRCAELESLAKEATIEIESYYRYYDFRDRLKALGVEGC